jgi:hypothetical protein
MAGEWDPEKKALTAGRLIGGFGPAVIEAAGLLAAGRGIESTGLAVVDGFTGRQCFTGEGMGIVYVKPIWNRKKS